MNNSVVVLGDGLLGSEIVKQTGWDNISRKKNNFDITESNKFPYFFVEDCYEGLIFSKRYKTIVNCIANTDTYSIDKKTQWEINYKGTADLVDFCNSWDIKLVHISSDYVYTNSQSNVSEEDVPVHGNNWYSYTKLLADAYIELKSKDYLICRGTHKPYPFPYDKAWIDQIGNFDTVDVMAGLIIKLIKSDAKGLFNVGTSLKSIYDLAIKNTRTYIEPALKPDFIPSNTSMNTDKLNKWLSENS